MSTITTLPPQGGQVVRVEDYLPWTADEFPPGTFDGFTHEMMLDVRQAARDAAQASVSRLLGRLSEGRPIDPRALGWDDAMSEIESLPIGATIVDDEGWRWRRVTGDVFEGIPRCWDGPDGLVPADHMLARSVGVLCVVSGQSEDEALSDHHVQLAVSGDHRRASSQAGLASIRGGAGL